MNAEIENLEEAKDVLDRENKYLEEKLSDLAKREQDIIQILDFIDRPAFPMEAVITALDNFNARKHWILSEARERLKQEKEAKLAQTRRAYLDRQKKEKRTCAMYQTMSFDEEQKR